MLQVVDLHKRFGDRVALNGVSLSVAPGETVVVMGPSGCGKSTLLRCINRLIEPDAGDVFLAGRSLRAMNEAELRAARREIGFVFQHFHLIERLSVLDNAALGLVMAGMPREEAEARALAALERVQLASEANRFPHQLSGGQRQRAAIARALAGGPRLMLWDEPTAALDPVLVGEVLDVMEELAQERSTAMLIVTHEVRFAAGAADRVVLMEEGRVVDEGPPAVVFGQPRTNVARQYGRLLAR
ncbi:MAG: amino acid ABC transporter ATP-binding protein [Limnochordales bacterium]|nr:peptide ABC transporter ATP-binding protein [Bacillota bacterium]